MNSYYTPVHVRYPAVSKRDTITVLRELSVVGVMDKHRGSGVLGWDRGLVVCYGYAIRTGIKPDLGESGEPSRPSDVFSSGKMKGDEEDVDKKVRDEAGQVKQRPGFT